MKKSTVLLLLTLILLMQFGLRVPFLSEPMEGDEGVYAYIAKGLLLGEVPYRDTFDHKPPGIYFIYAGIYKLFGEDLFTLRLVTSVLSLFSTLAVFLIGSCLLGSAGGLLSAFLYGIFSGGPFLEGTMSNTEGFMVIILLFALYLFYLAENRKKLAFYLAAGILSGLAFMIKQVAVFNFLVFLFFAFLSSDRMFSREGWQRTGLLIAGLAVFPIMFTAYFWIAGAFREFFLYAFMSNLGYVRPMVGVFTTKWGIRNLFRVTSLLLEDSIPLLLSFAAGATIVFKDRSRPWMIVLFWSIASLMGALLGGYYFGHYFLPLLPGLAILSIYALVEWRKRRLPLIFNLLGVMTILVLSVFVILNSYRFYLSYSGNEISYARYHIDNLSMAKEAGEIIRKRSNPEDTILVVGGDPTIYFYSGRRCPSHFIGLPYLFPELFKRAFIEAEEVIQKRAPKYVILTRPVYDEFFSLLMSNYKIFLQRKGRWHDEVVQWGIFERKKR